MPYQAVYGASKSYVLSLSRALGRELRPQGIHVMCVCPGWIKTEFQQVAHHDEYIRYVDKWYGPDEVAAQAMKDLKKKKVSPFSVTRCAVRCVWSSSCRWTPSWISGASSRGSSETDSAAVKGLTLCGNLMYIGNQIKNGMNMMALFQS